MGVLLPQGFEDALPLSPYPARLSYEDGTLPDPVLGMSFYSVVRSVTATYFTIVPPLDDPCELAESSHGPLLQKIHIHAGSVMDVICR